MSKMDEQNPPPPGPAIAADQVICTLYEGDFYLGVGTLINSIVRGGFKGLFWIGCRGELPKWIDQLKRREDGLFEIGEARMGFEKIEGERHFGQFKPEFMVRTIERGIAGRYIWYFDPDITVRCSWSFYEMWVRYGVCLCQDVTMSTMPSRHPFRCAWTEMAKQEGWGEPLRAQERYYNSGFVGLDIAHRAFLDQWIGAIRIANKNGVTPGQFQKGDRSRVFYTVDQDTLNIAAMYADAPLSTVGPEGMGFAGSGFTMYHSVSVPKPWRKKFLSSLLRGSPPTNGDKHFLQCADGPLRIYSRWELNNKRLRAGLAALLGRFYRKS
jgi:hypothetical protein